MADSAISNLPTELAVKPNNLDVFAIDNISAVETQKIKYSTLKSFFVKTDEDSEIGDATHQYHVKLFDDCKLKFGNNAEGEVSYSSNSLLIENTYAGADIVFTVSSGSITIDAFTKCLKLHDGTWSLNASGDASHGVAFNASTGAILARKHLEMQSGANIDLGNQYINGSGASGGLSFSGGLAGTFSSTLNVSGVFNANKSSDYSINCVGHFKMGRDKCFNENGDSGHGISFNATAPAGQYVTCYDNFNCDENIKIASGKAYKVHLSTGITTTINLATATSITVTGGIITSYT